MKVRPSVKQGATLSESRRNTIGVAAAVVGLLTVFIGVMIAHWTRLPEVDEFGRQIGWDFIPRGWVYYTIGQLIAVGGSQIVVIGAVWAWIYDRHMTWARASVAALLAWFQLILFFGIIPSEWLNLAQGPLGWTSKPAFTIPSWIVLNNDVTISFRVLKDLISAGYYTNATVAAIYGAYKVQMLYKESKTGTKPAPISEYGRPMRVPETAGADNGR